MRTIFALLVFSILPVPAAAQHNALLPSPQELHYGAGLLAISGLSIHLQSNTQEERFAASELAKMIYAKTGNQLAISENARNRTKAIELRRTGDSEPLPTPGEKTGPESREAYQLQVGSRSVTVEARTSAGLFYGVETLAQLAEKQSGQWNFPEVTIKDWPRFVYRGTMVDFSEGPLPTEQEVGRQIDLLARWKGNQYFLYNEDNIELEGFPLLNPQARFTQEQIRQIIAYGKERHVDVVPCLELYGHQHDLFRIEKYSKLADMPHGGEFDPAQNATGTLLNKWIQNYLRLFPSRFVHIGFDETWQIAQAAKAKGGGTTPAKLFLDQLNIVVRRFQEADKFVMAWGDIMVKYPGIVSQLPKGLAAVPWWYEPDPDPQYKKWLEPLMAEHLPIFVAPGVNGWEEIVPDYSKSFRNIDTFLAAGEKARALGVINTLWTDDQEALHRMTWPGVAYGAAAAWQSNAMKPEIFFSGYCDIAYPPATAGNVARGLSNLSEAELTLQKVDGITTMENLWRDPFEPEQVKVWKQNKETLQRARTLAEEAEQNLMQALGSVADSVSLDSLILGSRMLDFAAMRELYAVEINDLWAQQQGAPNEEQQELLSSSFSQTHGRVGDILDALSLLIPEYRKNWLAEYTPYRLDTALVRWQAEYQYWWRAERRYRAFRANALRSKAIPSLQELIGRY